MLILRPWRGGGGGGAMDTRFSFDRSILRTEGGRPAPEVPRDGGGGGNDTVEGEVNWP
jgi:hypothetical protein